MSLTPPNLTREVQYHYQRFCRFLKWLIATKKTKKYSLPNVHVVLHVPRIDVPPAEDGIGRPERLHQAWPARNRVHRVVHHRRPHAVRLVGRVELLRRVVDRFGGPARGRKAIESGIGGHRVRLGDFLVWRVRRLFDLASSFLFWFQLPLGR